MEKKTMKRKLNMPSTSGLKKKHSESLDTHDNRDSNVPSTSRQYHDIPPQMEDYPNDEKREMDILRKKRKAFRSPDRSIKRNHHKQNDNFPGTSHAENYGTIPYQSTRRGKNLAFKYQSKVLLYVASSLSRNDAIDDFWMVSNPQGIDRFNDIVLRMSLKNADPIVIFVKVIFTSKPVSFELLQKEQDTSCEDEFLIKLWEYREDFERFMDGKEQNVLRNIFKDVDKDKHFFCIFTTSKAIDSKLQTNPFDSDYIMEFLDASVGKKARKCQIDDNTPFGKQLYIFLDQPDIDDIGSVQANILGKHLTTKHLNELETRINKYMFQGTNSCSLTKYNFDKLCLEVIFDDYMLSDFPHVLKIDEQYIQLWMELYSGDEIINVDNYDKICPLLGYFLQQQIQRLTDTPFTWKTGLTDEIKEKIFDKYRNNERVTYNEPRVTNIKELLILLRKVENMPLIIKPEHALNMVNILKVYKHLKKNNFIIFSGGEIYDNVISNVGQISRESTLKKILEIELSILGRPRLPLSDITFIRLDQESSAFLRATAESSVLQNIAISQLLQWTAEGNDRTIGQTIREQNKYYISRRFCEVTTEKQLTEEELVDAMENGAQVCTIWGEPGMGKSEVLRSLAYKYSSRKMVLLVEIRPNLDFDDATGFDLIKKCLDTKSDKLVNSIYDTYTKNNHIVLFMDNYDYIPQEYKDKMEEALHTILENDRIPIFVTTKTDIDFPTIHKNNKITSNLLPLSDNDLDQYCKHHKMSIYKDNNVLKHIDISFWRNPLHLSMIKSHHSPSNLQKSEICEELVRLKLAIYCEISNLKPDEIAIPFMDYHNNFALLCTFGEEFVISAKLMRKYEVKNIVKIIADKGLVTGTNSKNDVQFIHKTYGDYFVANWLYKYKDEEESTDISNKLKKSEPNCDILNIFDELIRRETEQCNKQAHCNRPLRI